MAGTGNRRYEGHRDESRRDGSPRSRQGQTRRGQTPASDRARSGRPSRSSEASSRSQASRSSSPRRQRFTSGEAGGQRQGTRRSVRQEPQASRRSRAEFERSGASGTDVRPSSRRPRAGVDRSAAGGARRPANRPTDARSASNRARTARTADSAANGATVRDQRRSPSPRQGQTVGRTRAASSARGAAPRARAGVPTTGRGTRRDGSGRRTSDAATVQRHGTPRERTRTAVDTQRDHTYRGGTARGATYGRTYRSEPSYGRGSGRSYPDGRTSSASRQARAPYTRHTTADSSGYARSYTRRQRQAPRSREERIREQRASNARLNGNIQPRFVGIIIVVIVVLVGILWWNNRAVAITIDGTEASIRVGSSLEAVYADATPVTAGDYVDVSGSVITQGGGDEFKANVDGNDLSSDEASSYAVRGGESITFSDGDDRMEPYTVDYEEEQPKLEMQGDEGVVYYVAQWGKVGKKEIRHGTESGKTAEGDTVQEVQNLVIQRCNPTPSNGEKLVALTFDDGPADPYTDEYLDILEEKGIKATFNLIGEQIDEFKDQVNRIKDEGHQITSHTWDHAQLTTLSKSSLRQELDDTYAKIEEDTGYETTTLRPPYGSFMTDCWLYSGGSTSVAAIWTHDSDDWRMPGADTIVENCTKDMATGSIILMHDGGGDRTQDVEALPKIIDAWQDAGYRFVTLSELLQSDDSIPDDIASCDAKMPDDAVWPTEVASGSENKGTA